MNPLWEDQVPFMDIDHLDSVVIGGGVVGLAIARGLAEGGCEVAILERQDAIGSETSSRNSEVIHAGIYYPSGSLKAQTCVRGRELLYDYCRARGITARKMGKLIVATDAAQIANLEALDRQARANGVEDLEFWEAAKAMADQQALSCVAALFSPSSGVLDSHTFMLSLLGDVENAGGFISLSTDVAAIERHERGFLITTAGEEPYRLTCRQLVNAAGHASTALARTIDGIRPESVPKSWLTKGNYFKLAGKAPFSRLIYPVPEPGGLGVHITLDLGGQARFGPDVEWVEDFDYRVDPTRALGFYAAVRRYWPGLPDDSLLPDYAGIRPKIVGPGEPAGDFVISDAADHGLPGLVCLYGIESPGLTASLALAEAVLSRLEV